MVGKYIHLSFVSDPADQNLTAARPAQLPCTHPPAADKSIYNIFGRTLARASETAAYRPPPAQQDRDAIFAGVYRRDTLYSPEVSTQFALPWGGQGSILRKTCYSSYRVIVTEYFIQPAARLRPFMRQSRLGYLEKVSGTPASTFSFNMGIAAGSMHVCRHGHLTFLSSKGGVGGDP